MPPTGLNRYRILERIGQGSSGKVFRAYDAILGRHVALKIITRRPNDDEVVERFRREALAAAQLTHPNVVTVYESGREGGEYFTAMELLKGVDIRGLIRAKAPLSLTDKYRLILQVCAGVGHAHERKIVHRDLTPSNLHILPDGQVKIIDFGLVRLASSNITQTGTIMGTPYYMSPEQAEGRRVGPASDVFSIGVVFYEFLAYRKPFRADGILTTLYRIIHEDHPPLPTLVSDVPQSLVDVIDKALSKDAGARFDNANEFLQALQQLTEDKQFREVVDLDRPSDDLSGILREQTQVIEGRDREKTSTTDHVSHERDVALFTSLAGNLTSTPLAAILKCCAAESKTGALHIRRGAIEKRFFFVGGRLFSTATNSPRETLGQHLIRVGYVSEKQLFEALSEQERSHKPLGELLVDKKLVEEAKLTNLIRLKSEESLFDCFLWPDGEFAFEDGHIPEKMYLATALDIPGLIRESETRAQKWTKICELFPSARTTFTVTGAFETAKVLSEEHRRVVALIERGMSLAEIALEMHAMEFRISSCLLDLYEQKVIRIGKISEGRSYEASVEQLRTLLREGLTYFNAGDHPRALPAFQAALEIDPQSKAHLYIKKIENTLGKQDSKVPLPLDAVPVLAVPVADLATKDLTHQEGFVLSRVNGDWNIGSILSICPMSEIEVVAIFRKLEGSGLIAIKQQSAAS